VDARSPNQDHRRREPRQLAGWRGLCLIEGDAVDGWRECRVVDISILGLGMTFHYLRPTELVGRGLSIEVPALGDAVKNRFEGTIKNAAASIVGGPVRVGVEFDGLSSAERAMIALWSTLSHGSSEVLAKHG
jgi:hypothetical protein